jgi:hypothetical protein
MFALDGARGIIHGRGRRIAARGGFEATMFRVDVQTLEAYFAFDPRREADLHKLDELIRKAAQPEALLSQGRAGGRTGHAL